MTQFLDLCSRLFYCLYNFDEWYFHGLLMKHYIEVQQNFRHELRLQIKNIKILTYTLFINKKVSKMIHFEILHLETICKLGTFLHLFYYGACVFEIWYTCDETFEKNHFMFLRKILFSSRKRDNEWKLYFTGAFSNP